MNRLKWQTFFFLFSLLFVYHFFYFYWLKTAIKVIFLFFYWNIWLKNLIFLCVCFGKKMNETSKFLFILFINIINKNINKKNLKWLIDYNIATKILILSNLFFFYFILFYNYYLSKIPSLELNQTCVYIER